MSSCPTGTQDYDQLAPGAILNTITPPQQFEDRCKVLKIWSGVELQRRQRYTSGAFLVIKGIFVHL